MSPPSVGGDPQRGWFATQEAGQQSAPARVVPTEKNDDRRGKSGRSWGSAYMEGVTASAGGMGNRRRGQHGQLRPARGAGIDFQHGGGRLTPIVLARAFQTDLPQAFAQEIGRASCRER